MNPPIFKILLLILLLWAPALPAALAETPLPDPATIENWTAEELDAFADELRSELAAEREATGTRDYMDEYMDAYDLPDDPEVKAILEEYQSATGKTAGINFYPTVTLVVDKNSKDENLSISEIFKSIVTRIFRALGMVKHKLSRDDSKFTQEYHEKNGRYYFPAPDAAGSNYTSEALASANAAYEKENNPDGYVSVPAAKSKLISGLKAYYGTLAAQEAPTGLTGISAYVSRLMSQLQHLFDDKKIIVKNESATLCPELESNIKSEYEKIANIPAELDTRIYIYEETLYKSGELKQEMAKHPGNNSIFVFMVKVSNEEVTGEFNKDLTNAGLTSLNKYNSIKRTVASGANKCAVAEKLIKDFFKDYSKVLTGYYTNLNKQFTNKICKDVNLSLTPGMLGSVAKDGLEDHAGLPSSASKEITDYINEFSTAYGHSIKVYFTSQSSLASTSLKESEGAQTGYIVFDNVKDKFDKSVFDGASYGIWLHYDDNSGCIYIRHGLNENKVFSDSRKSKLTKPSDKEQIIAEAKKTIDNVLAGLNSRGAHGLSFLEPDFKTIWKATVGSVATVYDMGRETYETGQTPVRLWDTSKDAQYRNSPFHDPTEGIAAGGGDAIVAKVLEIPQLVSFCYDIAAKEEVRTGIYNTAQATSWVKIQKAAADFFNEKKDKYAGGGNVMKHEATLDASTLLLEMVGGAKILEILDELLKKLGNEAREAVVNAVRQKLTDPGQLKRFLLDMDGSDDLLNAVAKNTDLVDGWKVLNEANLDDALRKNLKYLEDIKDYSKQYPNKLNELKDGLSKAGDKNIFLNRKLYAQKLGRSPSSTVLGENLEAIGKTRPANSAAHHIVPGGETYFNAKNARQLLQKENIDINEATNGAFLPKSSKYVIDDAIAHSKVHTNKYYDNLFERLNNAPPGKVRNELDKIAQELINGTFPY